MRRGYNEIEISLVKGDSQKVVWVEMYVAP